MASWRPDHSIILSLLLDTVVGTQKAINIRQDYCQLKDCHWSTRMSFKNYFTGSKSEGLDLPGSDLDYMLDVNNLFHIKVIQSLNEYNNTSPYNTFFMCTENVPPGFAILQLVHQIQMHSQLQRSSQFMNGLRYLSSDLFMENYVSHFSKLLGITVKRQGPSAEIWIDEKSESGTDNVASIHCPFWPNEASEWVQRTRKFSWPTPQDISSIINFGFHLVPVGHPHSKTRMMEWRISFSMAERTLVWSFNHVQMQCYAVMKIILKEFIKVRCQPQNHVLCSYFMKTFLFWKYETTELNFWRADNFIECVKCIFAEFSKCIHNGVLRHYFIPRFNLLSVKLTPEAQRELLHLFDIINQCDIRVLKECRTLRDIWSKFIVQVPENKNDLISHLNRENLLRNDQCMKVKMSSLNNLCMNLPLTKVPSMVRQFSNLACKTHLNTVMLRQYLFQMHRNSLMHIRDPGNKGICQLFRSAQSDVYSCDISTCKLWYAMLLCVKGFNLLCLDIVNQVLSSIPPYAMYQNDFDKAGDELKQLYVDMFLDSDITITQRARKAWMFNLIITKYMTNLVPFALQIELYFSHNVPVRFSPFTCAYYLQFLCYHRMHQYENRDRTLRQLIEVVNNRKQCHSGEPHTSYNILGHCMLLAGKRDQAREMFYRSYFNSQNDLLFHSHNSAPWYLRNCF